ncbi:MAG: hypothetical protein KAX49_12405 [Halanaerobiales bacterium]|nr:hypothetical protein [Halanaerobiales bacterium]
MSIKQKLVVLFLILTLLPMGIIAVYSISTSTVALKESGTLFLEAKLEAFAQIVIQEVGGRNLSAFLQKVVLKNLADRAKEEKYFKNGYLRIIKRDGTVVYDPDESLVDNNLVEESFVASALEQKEGYYHFVDEGIHYEGNLSYNEDLEILLWALVPRNEVYEVANKMKTNILWSILAVGVIISIIGLLVANSISNPLKKVVGDVTHIAENLDFTSLTIKEYENRKDEIGVLANSVTKLVENWTVILEKAKVTSKNLLESGAQLAEASEDSSAASEEISASIEEVATRANDQTNFLNQTKDAINQLVRNLSDSSRVGEDALSLASTTLETASMGQKSINAVVTQMNNINLVIGQISEVVESLVLKSNKIGEIVNLIDSIANQTQLLALNAAIEAARAGEAGRGFSVVSDEIKQLAEESMKSANQIKGLINEIQNESNKASEAMDTGKQEVKTGVKVVDEAGNLFNKITTASATNLKGSEQANKSLKEAINNADIIIDRIQEVAGIAEETASSAQEVSASTEEQTATMEQVSASATILKEMAIELQKIVSQFKLD